MADYVVMSVRVTREAADVWHSFAAEHGITVSAMGEAMTPFLQGVTEYPDALSDFVGLARKIKDDRNRRPGRGLLGALGQETGQGTG